MQDRNNLSELKQQCLTQISSGLTKDLEAPYIQAYATLTIAEQLWWIVERQEEAAKVAQQGGGTKKGNK